MANTNFIVKLIVVHCYKIIYSILCYRGHCSDHHVNVSEVIIGMIW
jgi:hypothetical protein